jgi:hypothetical protein
MLARLACCLVLVLVPTAAACGDDERASAPGDPDRPVSGPANAGGGDRTGVEPASERTCRRLARRLAGTGLEAARARASARGCTLRVAVRDGRGLALTEDYRPGRINVRVRDGVVTGVEFMG